MTDEEKRIDYKLIESKVRKMVLPNNPLDLSLKKSSDWVSSVKICLQYLISSLDRFANQPIMESLSDDFIEGTDIAIYHLSNDFMMFMRRYANILDRYYKPTSSVAKTKIQNELEEYWKKLNDSLANAQKTARSIKGKAVMLNIWDSEDFASQRKFLERLENASLQSIKNSMENAQFPLGDDVVQFED